ncbi:MAG: 16S rRNA (guanine(527)-N(7))-methyltransferase RsmG [Gemmatimonadetes bacterium]|nr:16S rRNA (guanine(527)-N(7))-methyltransferase RsmG [Gemmatimonadota bacterium]
MSESILDILGPTVEDLGGAPAGWVDRLERYADLVRERNQAVNLVSRRSADRFVEGQLLPCLAVLRLVRPGTPVRVLDVGTGGGLPGIPLKILRPETRVDLVDATRKKVDFVREAIETLGLGGAVAHWGRIEDPPPSLRERAPFELWVSRAVGEDARLDRARREWCPDAEVWVFCPPGTGEFDFGAPGRSPVTALRKLSG